MDISMWLELKDVFQGLASAYEKAAELGRRKHSALVGIDMKSLEKVLNEEQLIIAKIQRLENARGDILKEMAKSDPSITSETKMADFIELAPDRQLKAKLKILHKELSRQVEETVRLRDDNQILAQGALDAVKYHLNRLSSATIEPSYSNKGGNVVTHKKNFDFKA